MSHIATIKTEIKDLEALKLACRELGLTFLENQKTCKFYPVQNKPPLHPCDHAIAMPTHADKTMDMELGLVKTPTGYNIAADDLMLLSENCPDGQFWAKHIFGTEVNPLGKKYGKLLQAYGVNKAILEARRKGYTATRKHVNGSIQVCITGM